MLGRELPDSQGCDFCRRGFGLHAGAAACAQNCVDASHGGALHFQGDGFVAHRAKRFDVFRNCRKRGSPRDVHECVLFPRSGFALNLHRDAGFCIGAVLHAIRFVQRLDLAPRETMPQHAFHKRSFHAHDGGTALRVARQRVAIELRLGCINMVTALELFGNAVMADVKAICEVRGFRILAGVGGVFARAEHRDRGTIKVVHVKLRQAVAPAEQGAQQGLALLFELIQRKGVTKVCLQRRVAAAHCAEPFGDVDLVTELAWGLD